MTGVLIWSQVIAPESPCCCGKRLPIDWFKLGARLEHARARDLQREVVPIRGLDQAVEDRVAEDLPPVGVRGVERLLLHGRARAASSGPRRSSESCSSGPTMQEVASTSEEESRARRPAPPERRSARGACTDATGSLERGVQTRGKGYNERRPAWQPDDACDLIRGRRAPPRGSRATEPETRRYDRDVLEPIPLDDHRLRPRHGRARRGADRGARRDDAPAPSTFRTSRPTRAIRRRRSGSSRKGPLSILRGARASQKAVMSAGSLSGAIADQFTAQG